MSHGRDGGDYRCFACGRRTGDVTAGGPSPEEAGQDYRWATGVLDVDGKAAVACWECFWKTDPDLWIADAHWDALGPLVSARDLLPLREGLDADPYDPDNYPFPQVPR